MIRPSSTASFFVSEEEEEYCFVFASCLCTARLIRIVRPARLSEAAKGQELLVAYCPSSVVSVLLHLFSLLLCCLSCITAERLRLLCLDLSVCEQTA